MRQFLRTFIALALVIASAHAAAFTFSTGAPDGRMAVASQPSGPGIEIEAADDFIVGANGVSLTQATFTGLIPLGTPLSAISFVGMEIYRVFPLDSTNPPSGSVPTRTNSPSDIEFDGRDSGAGSLSFTATLVSPTFSAANSVLNGINKSLTPATGGEGAVSGQEVIFTLTFTTPISLPGDHYFFVPQVTVTGGTFYWLSTTGPAQFTGDLQAWVRNANLDPDWLRIGTDIVGGTTPPRFDMAFSLDGTDLPEPGAMTLVGLGLVGLALLRRRR